MQETSTWGLLILPFALIVLISLYLNNNHPTKTLKALYLTLSEPHATDVPLKSIQQTTETNSCKYPLMGSFRRSFFSSSLWNHAYGIIVGFWVLSMSLGGQLLQEKQSIEKNVKVILDV
ncbi:MAG: hypothetical protein ACFFBD_05295 [Candidatus Hodarchaeota archaeon]